MLLPGSAQAAEKIKLQVALTAGRDPNVNIVQDYGNVRWSEVLAQEFQKEYPNIEVEFVVSTMQKVTVLIASGIGPDIVNGASSDFVNLGRQGAFVDLAPLMKKEGIDYLKSQTFWEPQYRAFMDKNVIFALPQYLGTIAMYYNAEMLDNMGINRPSPSLDSKMDWDDFESMAKKLTRDTNGDAKIDVYGFKKDWNGHRVGYWMQAAGAEFYRDGDNSRSALDSDAAVKGLEFLQNLRWGSHVIAPPGVSPSWEKGQAAIEEDGSFRLVSRLGTQQSGAPKIPFSWNVFPMPIGPSGQRATMATIDGYAVSKASKHPLEAYALTKFLAGPEANAIMAKYVALQPANRRVIPEYIRLMRQMNHDVYDINVNVFTDAGPYAYPQYLYSNQEVAESIIGDALRRVWDKNEPARPVWMEAIQRLNRILATATKHIDVSDPESVTWSGAKWIRQDYNVSVGGKAEVKGDKLILSASGADIWGVQDGCGYLYQKVKGDFTATVLVHQVPDGNTWSKAGIMVRAKATPSSAQAMGIYSGANGIVMQYRQTDMGDSKSAKGKIASWKNGTPIWLRAVRKGTEVAYYTSPDGEKWTLLDKVQIDLDDEALVGLAVTSHVSAELGEAVFSNWELTRN